MPRLKAILFDMDGVLIDARDWHYEALNLALQPFGMHISRDEHLSTYDGLSTRQKLDILHRARGLPKGLQTFINDLKQQHTQALIAARCRPTFRHRYMLSRLRQAGYQLALCSNSIRETVDSMVTHAGLTTCFDITLSNQDVTHPKPAPDIYLEAMRCLGRTPDSCLVVEDNANGIAAARAARAHVLEVSDPEDVTYDRLAAAINAVEHGETP